MGAGRACTDGLQCCSGRCNARTGACDS
jgi:hypothetical protein